MDNKEKIIDNKIEISGIHMNIRSIRKNIDQLKIFAKKNNYKWDFMALTECWGNSSDLEKENLNITGYKLIIKGKNIIKMEE